MSDRERFELVADAFLQASRLPAERVDEYLQTRFGDDAQIKLEVRRMLAAAKEGSVFESLARELDPLHAQLRKDASERPTALEPAGGFASEIGIEREGDMIGRYRLLELIGEGGFGRVWTAEQRETVQRKVAIKVIKVGMDTRQVVARFDQERQALAMMEHPSIAKVFDAGATATGRPYFVMELCKGLPISQFCDQMNLSVAERLGLVEQVCAAVQHAHTKGIIHRDIKPANVLVSMQDGRPLAKVIDFGIAKATEARLTERTLFTAHRQMIGTPEYMSPEQAGGSLDIDTRTDVYALGVLLYELLTGSTPFSSHSLRSAAFGEIERIIREVDPPKPSTRLSKQTGDLARVAASRGIAPARLGSMVRGELDWIVMKALEKDRQLRYETPTGLALDIRRYLSGETVSAAPPSATYRLNKFVRRHKAAVATGALVSAALVLGLIGTSVGLMTAERARDAESTQRRVAEAARAEAVTQEAEAKVQAAIASAVARFQGEMLAAVNPENLPRDPVTNEPLLDRMTVVQAIEAGIRQLDNGALKDQPKVEASVRDFIGTTLEGLGRLDEAEVNLRKSLAICRESYPAGHEEIASSLNNLAGVLMQQDKVGQAEPLLREALAIDRANLPAGHPDIATSLDNLAVLLKEQDKFAEAEPLYSEALEIRRAALPAGHPDVATTLNNLALLLKTQNKLADAEPLYREALESRRSALPAGHPTIAVSMNNLGGLLQAQGKLADAEPLLRDALEIWRATLPAGHPTIAGALANLADVRYRLGKTADARAGWDEAIASLRQGPSDGSAMLARVLRRAGIARMKDGNAAAALPELEEALALAEKLLGPDDPQLAGYRDAVASCRAAMGR
ncbi:MAG: serine/threonine-protein kinase [Phycisphaerales bacterium]|nr:serine/threonine-protein kinase [Phycisphaerales bacterium]